MIRKTFSHRSLFALASASLLWVGTAAAQITSGQSTSGQADFAQGTVFPPLPDPSQPIGDSGGAVLGSLAKWQPVTVQFTGPAHSERDDAPNPFLDYRLSALVLSPSGTLFLTPGFFDGDGQGGSSGDKWAFRFSPHEEGTWYYAVSFRQGPDVAVSDDPTSGSPVSFDGSIGSITVGPTDPTAPGFYRYGLLEHVGDHYRKFREGPRFLKTGVGGPENLFGYRGFDNTVDQPGGASTNGLNQGLHEYTPHRGDWNSGDPLFTSDVGVDSRGLIGAINYLSSVGLNSIYFLANNLGGDGRDTYPWVGPAETTFDVQHFDLSKLHQWRQVFDHAMAKGVMIHFGLGEGQPEAATLLDNGVLGTNRKLFYREMVSRFGYLLALEWDLCQENLYPLELLDEFAAYIEDLDSHDHPLTFQTPLLPPSGNYPGYGDALGDPSLGVASLFHEREDTGTVIERWRDASADRGMPWVVDSVVQGPVGDGLSEQNAEVIREKVLWPALFSGGNLEFYLGRHLLPEGGNLRLEDFRTRSDAWQDLAHARYLMDLMPFWQMEPADELLTGESTINGEADVFRLEDVLYAIYYPNSAAQGELDLTGTSAGTFAGIWYDPRSGEFAGTPVTYPAGSRISLLPPPDATGDGPYLEQGGLVVLQIENEPLIQDWTFDTSVSGWTGSGYYRYDGPNRFGGPGPAMQWDIEVSSPGWYNFSLHNYHISSLPDRNNDCWANVNGGNFQKVYSNNGQATNGVWNWASDFESTGAQAAYYLDAGINKLNISGRSNGFHIDRIHLWKDTVSDPLDLDLPESPRGGSGSPEDWVLLLVRIG